MRPILPGVTSSVSTAPSEAESDPRASLGEGVGLSRTTDGTELPPPARRRWSFSPSDRLLGWGGGVTLALVAFVMRVHDLGRPKAFQFDETYYAKDAWSLVNFGYARNYAEGANEKILSGTTTGDTVFGQGPSMVVHPEVGKWLIGLGEKAFGMDPFGWRIASAVVGALMVLLMVRFVRRVSGSTALGLLGGALLAFDGLHLVLSRLALLDIFLAFFILLGVHCVVADRQWFRDRLGDVSIAADGWGPRVLYRPWLLAAGVAFGLALGTKWTAAYPLAAFGLLVWAWSSAARKSRGARLAWLKSAVVDGIPAFVQLVMVAFVVYVSTWAGWMVHADKYEKALSNTQYTTFEGGKQWPTATEPDAEGVGEVVQSLRSLFHYHQDVMTFHTHFLNDATHTYASKPAGWILLNRPVGVDAQLDIKPGEQGCTATGSDTCMRQVLLIGTPVLWWGSGLALLAALALWVGGRDWRFGVAVVGATSCWLPWIAFQDRPIFLFYMVAALPFMVLAVTLVLGRLIGPSREPSSRRTVGVIVAGTFFLVTLLNFIWLWPILTDQLITREQWLDRMWFHRWI